MCVHTGATTCACQCMNALRAPPSRQALNGMNPGMPAQAAASALHTTQAAAVKATRRLMTGAYGVLTVATGAIATNGAARDGVAAIGTATSATGVPTVAGAHLNATTSADPLCTLSSTAQVGGPLLAWCLSATGCWQGWSPLRWLIRDAGMSAIGITVGCFVQLFLPHCVIDSSASLKIADWCRAAG
jgi:hypothetical protein